MAFQKYMVKDLCFYYIQYKKRKLSILLLCRQGFPNIGKLENGWSCLKSPYNALQTLEHWVRHVCLPTVSLGLHESFVLFEIRNSLLMVFNQSLESERTKVWRPCLIIKTKEAWYKSFVILSSMVAAIISYVKTKDCSTAKETSKFPGKF